MLTFHGKIAMFDGKSLNSLLFMVNFPMFHGKITMFFGVRCRWLSWTGRPGDPCRWPCHIWQVGSWEFHGESSGTLIVTRKNPSWKRTRRVYRKFWGVQNMNFFELGPIDRLCTGCKVSTEDEEIRMGDSKKRGVPPNHLGDQFSIETYGDLGSLRTPWMGSKFRVRNYRVESAPQSSVRNQHRKVRISVAESASKGW